MKKAYPLSMALLCATVVSNAQQTLTPELLWKMSRLGSVQASPNGSGLVYDAALYNLKENKGNKDLYLLDLKTKTTKKITSDPGNEFGGQWRPDGQKIGFMMSDGQAVQLWECKADGSDRKQVTSFDGGIGGYEYAASGKRLAYLADVKSGRTTQDIYPDLPLADARIIDDLMYRHWDAWDDYNSTHIFVTDYSNGAVSGTPVDIMDGEPYDAGEYDLSPDGNWLVYSCKKAVGKEYAISTNTDIYLYDILQKKTVNISSGMEGYDTNPVYSPDGKKIAWLSMARAGFEADRNRIFVYDLQKGTKEEWTVGFDQSSGSLVWSPTSKELYFISGINATYQVYVVDAASKKIRQITKGTHDYKSLVLAGSQLIGVRQSMSMPSEIYQVNMKDGSQEQISHINDDLLKTIKMGQVEERWVKTTDGKNMLVWVIYPPDFDKTKKYPTLLYCQGGPQSAVSQFFSYRWNFQLMAANGYIIVAPNRRGLPTFGQKWNDDISQDWGGQSIQDYLTAIDELSKEPFVNKDKLGAVGASYGGYSTYYLAGKHEKRFKVFISHCGLFNMESWYGSTEEYWFANYDLGGPYWKTPQPKSYEAFSPHKFVGNWDTPILVIHGQRDFRVPVTQGMNAFNAAQLRGIPSRFLYYPDEGHWVLQPQNGVLWHRVFFDWLDKYLK
ncbi:MAG: S9 family peptidase [Flavobacteriales bacterium]|nr:S9 family peptidase [Flavobacteriales bacterium]MCB9449451.1 S9 family peptidase [Flavobacteriales bacterium]